MKLAGEDGFEEIVDRTCSRKFVIRVLPNIHRDLAGKVEADGVSNNLTVGDKLEQ